MYCCHRRRQHRGVRTTHLCRTLSRRSLSALPASTAPRPTFVTIMIRPSDRDGMATDMPLFRPSGKAKYFLFWGLTRFLTIRSDLPVELLCRRCGIDFALADDATQPNTKPVVMTARCVADIASLIRATPQATTKRMCWWGLFRATQYLRQRRQQPVDLRVRADGDPQIVG